MVQPSGSLERNYGRNVSYFSRVGSYFGSSECKYGIYFQNYGSILYKYRNVIQNFGSIEVVFRHTHFVLYI